MLIGYARVSTGDQNLDLQKNALIRAECELVFEDMASGKNARRPGLKRALRLRPGDVLVVWKLDRLGRSVRDLITLVSELQARGVNFRSLTDSIDTSTPAGRFFFHVMSALAEMERELIVEACSRTIRQIHKPSFDYADKILRDWKNAGVKSFRDVSELDKKRKEEGGAKRRQASAGSSRSSNRFHNLEEHGYDYDEMVWSMINGAQKTGGDDGTQ